MKCLDIDGILQAETRSQWQELWQKYHNHCHGCRRLLEMYRPQIERRIADLEELTAILWQQEEQESAMISGNERRKMLVEEIPWLFDQVAHWQIDVESWQFCQEVVAELKEEHFSWASRAKMREQMLATVCRMAAAWPDSWKQTPAELPQDWRCQIEGLLNQPGGETVLPWQDSHRPTVFYRPQPLRMAADEKSFEQDYRSLLEDTERWQEPLWQDKNEHVHLRIAVKGDKFVCKVRAKIKGELHCDYRRSDGARLEHRGRTSLTMELAILAMMERPSHLKIELDDVVVWQGQLPCFNKKKDK